MKKLMYVVVGVFAFASTIGIAQSGDGARRQQPTVEECQSQGSSGNQCGGGSRVCCANNRLNHI